MRIVLANWNLTRVNPDMYFAKQKYVLAGKEEQKPRRYENFEHDTHDFTHNAHIVKYTALILYGPILQNRPVPISLKYYKILMLAYVANFMIAQVLDGHFFCQ